MGLLGQSDKILLRKENLGGGVYVELDGDRKYADIRKYFVPAGVEPRNEQTHLPTKVGIRLKLQQFSLLLDLLKDIRILSPALRDAKGCEDDDDHLSQVTVLCCSECNPYSYFDYAY